MSKKNKTVTDEQTVAVEWLRNIASNYRNNPEATHALILFAALPKRFVNSTPSSDAMLNEKIRLLVYKYDKGQLDLESLVTSVAGLVKDREEAK